MDLLRTFPHVNFLLFFLKEESPGKTTTKSGRQTKKNVVFKSLVGGEKEYIEVLQSNDHLAQVRGELRLDEFIVTTLKQRLQAIFKEVKTVAKLAV